MSTPPEQQPLMDRETLLRAALDAAGRGWHVFPLRPNDKRPAFPDHTADDCARRADHRCRTAGGHVGWEPRATTDPGRIRRAWSSAPYNVGVACGPSGLVVVDLDQPKADNVRPAEWDMPGVNDGMDVLAVLAERNGESLPLHSFTARTGRGGTHLYFGQPTGEPMRNTAGRLGWLIDTRAHGGYVVAPGSVVNGRPYSVIQDGPAALLPDWLAEALTPAPLPAQRPVTVSMDAVRTSRYVRTAIERECARVTEAPDHHNDALYLASIALGQLVAGGSLPEHVAALELERAGLAAGLKHGAVLRTIRSGFRAGAGRPRSVAA